MNTRERLTVAAVVSAALHALLISGAWLPAPLPPIEHPPLEARLAPAPPPQQVARVPARPEASRRAPSHPHPAATRPAPVAPAVISQAADAPAAEPSAEVPPAPSEPAAAAAERLEPQRAAAEPPAAAPVDAAPVLTVVDGTPPRSLPRKGTITYELTGEGFNVGKAVQSWEVGEGSYKLASDAATTGIVEIFSPQRFRWLSKGTVTRKGLRPESFVASRTRRGRTEASEALFDWKGGNLTYGSARERATAALPVDTQDIMSFIYQLSLAPPTPGRYRLPITTGTRFETYEIEVRAEENIETPLGTLLSLPVKQQRRPGTESIEIWLAAQYRYLPVKIRYFNRDGNPVGEQVASDIRVSLD